MNQLKTDKRKAVVAALVDGNSINSTVRMTGIAKTTILRLLRDLGCACAAYHNDHVRGLKQKNVQADEVWSFVHCKQKNVRTAKAMVYGAGDCYTWTAIDPDTKLIITYLVGQRTGGDAAAFMDDLSGRVINIGQLTTDGFNAYPDAVKAAFDNEVDYAQLVKHYKTVQTTGEARYSPATCTGCTKQSVIGFPDPDHISASIVERSNLTIRMSVRRFTRLTNGHSKKIENHGHAFALFVMHYNCCRKHETLKGRTPAMAAGLADHAWTLDELIELIK